MIQKRYTGSHGACTEPKSSNFFHASIQNTPKGGAIFKVIGIGLRYSFQLQYKCQMP